MIVIYTIHIKNISEKDVRIKEICLTRARFNPGIEVIVSDGLPVTLGTNEELEVEIHYKSNLPKVINDSILIYTDCLQFKLPILGVFTGLPKIEVSYIDFGDAVIGRRTRYNQDGKIVNIIITNNGTDDLVITDYYFSTPQDPGLGPFFYAPYPVYDTVSPEEPWVIKPSSSKTIKHIYFLPSEVGSYETRLYFESNAVDVDLDSNRKDYAIIKGNGIQDNTHIESGIGGNTYSLLPISPNPFNGTELTINYTLGQAGDVNINIYNTAGELVKEVVNSSETAGQYSRTVNISDLVSGTYIITMKSRAYETQQQLMIVK